MAATGDPGGSLVGLMPSGLQKKNEKSALVKIVSTRDFQGFFVHKDPHLA